MSLTQVRCCHQAGGVVTASRKNDMSLTQVRCCRQAGGVVTASRKRGMSFTVRCSNDLGFS